MPANIVVVNGKEYIVPDSRMPELMAILEDVSYKRLKTKTE